VAELQPEQRDLDFGGVERARDHFVRGEKNSPVAWSAGLDVLIEGDAVWIMGKGAALPVTWPQAPPREIHLEVPLALSLNSGWRLEGREEQIMSAPDWDQGDLNQAWLDLDKSGEELILRRPRPGDRFQPLGLARGSMKLSDFFINEKLPKRARSAWPLICKGEEIVWVPGHRLAHPFRLQKGSRRGLQLYLKRE
jgi:tRNA(Ile)-lysidine synthase